MGHVSPRSSAEAGTRDDVPGREHRGVGAPRLQGSRELGAFGERVAASFLRRRGASIIAVNRRVGRDEIDLVAEHGGRRIAVEVKTRAGADPVQDFTDEQAAYLRRAAWALGAHRCDLITVRVGAMGVEVRWLPGVC